MLQFSRPPRFVASPVSFTGWVAAAACLAALAGCSKKEGIETYTVSRQVERDNDLALAKMNLPSHSAAAPQPKPEAALVDARLVGVLLPHADTTWVFKVLGGRELVTKHVGEVQKFVETIEFVDGKPKWHIPTSWREKKPAGQGRYATFVLDDREQPLELAVSAMAAGQNVADNVNRWRGQVKLPPQSAPEAEASAVELTTPGGPAKWLDVTGKYDPDASTAPFAAMGGAGGAPGAARKPAMPADHPPLPSIPAMPRNAFNEEDLPVRFQTPEGWRPSPPPQFSIAAFEVGDEDRAAVVTLSSASGNLLDNVNRWRGQLQLPPVDENALDTLATKMKVAGRDATFVELLGLARPEGQKATYVVMIPDAETTWFLKLTGDAAAAFRERDKFLNFATTMKFVDR